jgi:hypothetical protein
MRRLTASAAAALALAGVSPAAATAASAKVDVMVVGRSKVLRAATTVTAKATNVKVGRARCSVRASTPLAALLALRPSVSMRDYGCGAGSFFVERIGRERGAGLDGWVYKVGRKAPSVSAGTPHLRTDARVLWFWCHTGTKGCQRTLEVTASPAQVALGAPVTFTVKGYDDQGKGIAVAGATVRFAGARLKTNADGTATATAPTSAGVRKATAEKSGLAPSFPQEVDVG